MIADVKRIVLGRLDLLGAILAVAVWYAASSLWQPLWLPSPVAVVKESWRLIATGSLSVLAVSGKTLLLGLTFTFVVGGLMAVLMASNTVAERVFTPYINALLAAPQIALVPVFTFIWGNTEETRVVTTIAFSLAPVVLTWTTALKTPSPHLTEMATAFGAGPVARILHVRLPNAAASLVAGLRIGVMQGIKGVVGAEVLIGVVGLGKLITEASYSFDMVGLAAIALIIIVISIAIYVALSAIENRALRWGT